MIYDRVNDWQTKTFPQGGAMSKLYHLQKEITELLDELVKENTDKAAIQEEYADCFILLIGSAGVFGLNSDCILKSIREKMDINEKRTWGKPDEKGVVLHIKE